MAQTADRPLGFTLIELIITVAIVGILAAIAYPSYQEQVRRGFRADAKAALVSNAQYMERRFTENNYYQGPSEAIALVNNALPLKTSPGSGTTLYSLSLVDASTDTNRFLLQAVPTGRMTGDRCGTLTLNDLGQRGLSGATASPEECWSR